MRDAQHSFIHAFPPDRGISEPRVNEARRESGPRLDWTGRKQRVLLDVFFLFSFTFSFCSVCSNFFLFSFLFDLRNKPTICARFLCVKHLETSRSDRKKEVIKQQLPAHHLIYGCHLYKPCLDALSTSCVSLRNVSAPCARRVGTALAPRPRAPSLMFLQCLSSC